MLPIFSYLRLEIPLNHISGSASILPATADGLGCWSIEIAIHLTLLRASKVIFFLYYNEK